MNYNYMHRCTIALHDSWEKDNYIIILYPNSHFLFHNLHNNNQSAGSNDLHYT